MVFNDTTLIYDPQSYVCLFGFSYILRKFSYFHIANDNKSEPTITFRLKALAYKYANHSIKC